MAADREQVLIQTRDEWRARLRDHHADSSGIWLVTWKKDSGRPHLRYDDIVEEALCFGWIDSQARGLEGERTQLQLTPRRRGSNWSRTNKERVARLLEAGLIEPAGLAMIEAAHADGTWSALDDVENLVEPDDLCAALDGVPEARRHWDSFPPSTRRGILAWIQSARRTTTREQRIRTTVDEAGDGRRANQWRPRSG